MNDARKQQNNIGKATASLSVRDNFDLKDALEMQRVHVTWVQPAFPVFVMHYICGRILSGWVLRPMSVSSLGTQVNGVPTFPSSNSIYIPDLVSGHLVKREALGYPKMTRQTPRELRE